MMHKDLNAFKGGHTALGNFWEENQLTPPVALLNRDKSMHQSQGGNPQVTKAERGGFKTASLVGAILNHKDDKKGHHDIYHYHLEAKLGLFRVFPDVSNTRYGSHGDAAIEIITRLDFY
jgi:hypothetical protein